MHTRAESPLTQKLLDRIVRSQRHLIALETSNVDETIAHMRLLALRSGTAVYAWEPEAGIASLRESGLHVPGSKRITDALRYVLQSMHFGIYLFSDFASHLKSADTVLLRRLSRMQGPNERKLVFVGREFALPEELDDRFEHVVVEDEKQRRLRLRDGRWLN